MLSIQQVAKVEETRPLDRPVPGNLWYKAMRDVGYNFGPAFRTQKAISAIPGERRSRSLVSLQGPPLQRSASRYLIHPATFDGCLQITAPAMWEGVRWQVNELLVPTSINDIFVSHELTSGIDEAQVEPTADYSGTARKELAKSYLYHLAVYDTDARKLLLNVSGLSRGVIDRSLSVYDNHRYSQVVWNPDITFERSVYPSSGAQSLPGDYLDLALHKHSRLSVLEIAYSEDAGPSLWLESPESVRAAASRFVLAVPGLDELLAAQSKYSTVANKEQIITIDPSAQAHEAIGKAQSGDFRFDLLIYRSRNDHDAALVRRSRGVEA